MIVFSKTQNRARTLAVFLVLIVVLVSSCTLVPKEIYLVEPASRLEYDPQIYFRFSGTVLRDLIAGFGEKEMIQLSKSFDQNRLSDIQGGGKKDEGKVDLSSLDGILKRSRTIGAGIRGLGTNTIKMEAVLIGDFAPLSMRMGLAFDGNWRRMDDGGYQSTKYPLFIRPPSPGIVILSTEAMRPAVTAPSLSPYPAAFDGISRSDLFIAADGPTLLSSFSLPVETAAIPLKGIALAASYTETFLVGKDPAAAQAPTYTVEVRILMKDEASARAYRPVIRFLWVSAANRFFGSGSKAAALSPVQENDSYVVRGIELDSKELRRIIVSALLGG
ncbi:MAG: hypothetical protein NT061_08960 [Spirochaetes bacterium]|nr:hypothetical protein [Spirochaetota bacterium]